MTMPPFSDGRLTAVADARQCRPVTVGRRLAASVSYAITSDDGALVVGRCWRKGCFPRLPPLHCGAYFAEPGAYPSTAASGPVLLQPTAGCSPLQKSVRALGYYYH